MKNSDRACPITAVALFDRHQITKFRLLTLLDRPDRTEIRCFINMMNCLIDLCSLYTIHMIGQFLLHMFNQVIVIRSGPEKHLYLLIESQINDIAICTYRNFLCNINKFKLIFAIQFFFMPMVYVLIGSRSVGLTGHLV